jgi:hypothetical protein
LFAEARVVSSRACARLAFADPRSGPARAATVPVRRQRRRERDSALAEAALAEAALAEAALAEAA